jgi:transcriptional regulator with XRE-family HTH domain
MTTEFTQHVGESTKMTQSPENEVENISRALAVVIHARRRQIGISQEELAMRAHLHRTYISDLERGARNISVRNLCRIALALEIGSAALLGLAEERARLTAGNNFQG